MKKAQIVGFDLIIAVTIFATISVLIIVMWVVYQERLNDNLEDSEILNQAFTFTDYLISTPGKPTNWNTTTVLGIGLADRDRVISEDKLNNFSNLSYDYTKSLFNVNIQQYNYYIELKNLNETNLIIYYGYGLQAPNDAERVIRVRRLVIYKNETAVFETTLWKNEK